MSEIDKHMDAIRAGVGEAAKNADHTLARAAEAAKDLRETAAETLRDAQDKAGEAIGAASEQAEKALNDAREAFDHARSQAGETLKDARENVSDATERLRQKASEQYDRAQDWAHDRYDSLSRNATYARRRGVAQLNRSRRGIAAFVEENPVMIGVAGLAAGLLIGALLPRTRREDELLGPYADEARREGARYAKDVAQHGRDALSDNLRAMAEQRDGNDRKG